MVTYCAKTRFKKNKIIAYKIGNDFVILKFNSNIIRKYTAQSVGSTVLMIIKSFATSQKGLDEFIRNNKLEFSSE
jgi:hypothetical protein